MQNLVNISMQEHELKKKGLHNIEYTYLSIIHENVNIAKPQLSSGSKSSWIYICSSLLVEKLQDNKIKKLHYHIGGLM